MEENTNFEKQLEEAINQKKEWFDSQRLQEMLENYRILHTCTKTIDQLLEQKSIITPDPYKFENRITDIELIDDAPFPDQEIATILGSRLAKYEMVLDYLASYFRFTVDNLTLSKIKQLNDFNSSILWNTLSGNSNKINTRAVALCVMQARNNAPAITISSLNDSLERCSKCMVFISSILSELTEFQKELFKYNIRKNIIANSDFNKDKAMTSLEGEATEIRRVWGKVNKGKAIYNDLVQEIVNEDQAVNREVLRQNIFKRLAIPVTKPKTTKKEVNPHDLILNAAYAIGGIAPVLTQLYEKLTYNFNLLFDEKQTFIVKLKKFFRKKMGTKEKDKIVNLTVIDPRTNIAGIRKLNVTSFMATLEKKQKIYSGISAKGPEFSKLKAASEDALLGYVNKQIAENQEIYTIISSLDNHFKTNVEIINRVKVKGLKIDLSSFRNCVISVNQKRGDYISIKEEQEQMRKLGINQNV